MAKGKQRSKRVGESLRANGVCDKANTSMGRKEKAVETAGEGEKVICFCGEDREFGEMACCELCSGWYHFRCMRFKEDVDLLAKKDFVCCFCLASKTLSLLREVEALKIEVEELRERSSTEKGDIPTNKKDDKAERMATGKGVASYSAVVKDPRKEKRPHKEDPKPVSPSTGKKQTAIPTKAQKAEAAGKKATGPSPRAQQFVGRRKRVDTEEDIKAFLVPEAASVEVKRVFKSEDGRLRWWFWLMGEESALKLVDEGSFGEFWKIEKKSPFLESVVVRVLGR